jgi:UDP-N-acetylmuramyl pentapeptide phosphotransferase/UDP-N-acetylglucosamine-1-phosphate transferase
LESSILAISLAGGAFIISVITNAFLLRYLRKKNVLDIPNERSSHTRPTPRGGGNGIMAGVIIAGAVYAATTRDYKITLILGLSLVIGIVGLVDDIKRGLHTGLRFGIQLACAITLMCVLGPIDILPFPQPLDINLHWWGYLFGVVWLVGVTNIFNFLDGIDGYAGMQSLLAGGALAVIDWGGPVGTIGLFIAAAALGFLFFNWHPARIFMGDVGSSFLGFLFAALPFYIQSHARADFFFAMGIFLWFFLTDGVFVLVRRILKGEKIWVAHRSHLYQRLVISGLSHSRVVEFVLLLYVALYVVFFEYFVKSAYLAHWEIIAAGLLLFVLYLLFTLYREKKAKALK